MFGRCVYTYIIAQIKMIVYPGGTAYELRSSEVDKTHTYNIDAGYLRVGLNTSYRQREVLLHI